MQEIKNQIQFMKIEEIKENPDNPRQIKVDEKYKDYDFIIEHFLDNQKMRNWKRLYFKRI